MQHLVAIHKNDFVKDICRNLAYNPLLAHLPELPFSTNDCLPGFASRIPARHTPIPESEPLHSLPQSFATSLAANC
jgi:hypothetical protein